MRQSDKNRKARVYDLLGVSMGSATHRLRKMIMFKYVKKAGENFCHVCGLEIESAEDISIEHILPWENRSAELYWDLDNISFSHLKCNEPHNRSGGSVKYPSDGKTFRCSDCGEFKSPDSFYKNSGRWNGLVTYCKDCYSVRRKSWR